MNEHEPQCNGICLTTCDIGLPELGMEIAYPHPDCDLHGDEAAK